MTCFPLSENTYSVDDSKVFIPFDPSKDNVRDRPGSLIIDICPFLIETKNDLVVIDPGLGLRLNDHQFHIHKNIMDAGFNPEDVSMVLLSHLHKDHAGGTAFKTATHFEPMFSKAKYIAQQGEIDYAFKKGGKSFEMEKLEFLVKHKNFMTVSGDGKLNDDISFELTGAHTPYHQSFLIKGKDQQEYFYGGDVLPQSSQLIRRFVAKYDYDGKAAAEKRIEMGQKAATNNWICLYFHSTSVPMSRVRIAADGKFEIVKI